MSNTVDEVKAIWSHFILSGSKYYVLTSKTKYNVVIVWMLYCY